MTHNILVQMLAPISQLELVILFVAAKVSSFAQSFFNLSVPDMKNLSHFRSCTNNILFQLSQQLGPQKIALVPFVSHSVRMQF